MLAVISMLQRSKFPMVSDPNDARLQIDLETVFESMDVEMPNYRLAWQKLSGAASVFTSPSFTGKRWRQC